MHSINRFIIPQATDDDGARSLGQKFECLGFERVFCQTRQILAGIIVLFQENLTKYGEKLAKRQAFGTFVPGSQLLIFLSLEKDEIMRNKFDEQLAALNDMLTEMGVMIEKAITLAIQALVQQDEVMAKQAVAFDKEIDRMEKEIESLCLRLLLQQQPVARDLRVISAALKMITDMERIGDQAADISEITLMLIGETFIKKIEHITLMAEATAKMVNDSISAYVNMDSVLAWKVIQYDDVVDDLFVTVKNDLIGMIQADRANGEQAIDLIMIAKYFERIGDHATNIAEWVLFSITGRHVDE